MSETVKPTQSERLLKISSPLAPDTLVLRRLVVREAIGRCFSTVAEVVSANLDLQASALIGKPVTCTVSVEQVPPRHFHGIVRSFTRLGPFGRGLMAYRLETVPRLWQISRTADCRIFQDKSVKDIAGSIFSEHDVAPVRWGSAIPAAKRPYCVQFNETDLDFVQRLLDELGAGYFFEHGENNHTLVLCGAKSDYPLVGGDQQVVRQDGNMVGALTQWQPHSALQPGKVQATDFDGLKPGALLNKNTATILGTPGAGLEVFNWPGGQTVRPDADPSMMQMEGFEAGADLVNASGSDPTVFAGGRLKVLPGLDAVAPGTWLVTEVEHSAHDETHLSGDGAAGYSNKLVLMDADRPWRPAAPRRRPLMAGVHSAIVTGPSGEEIHCDEYGRIKVQFLWDRLGKKDDLSSCWVRVAQGFGGSWGGAWTLPRVNDEVLVAFVDGDADRPVVIGSVYNAEQKPIYALPANKTQSGIKTRSSKGGGAANFNELRFEDKKGSEEISVQAEKDMVVLIKHDRTETVKGKHTETVTMDHTATVEQGNETLLVKMGDISVKASAGKIDIEAMQSITLTCGPSVVKLDPSGISITAIKITSKGTAMVETEAPIVKETASGMMIIKGGLVMIN